MKKFLLSFLSAFLIFTLSAQVSENFTDYTVGGKLAQQAQAMGRDYWTTWSKLPGTNEDGLVASFDGRQVGHFTWGVDQILHLGKKTSGVWDFSCKIYIPAGKDGYFNIMSEFAEVNPSQDNCVWALQMCFACDVSGATLYPGQCRIYADAEGTPSVPTIVPFAHDTWVNVHVNINLDDDWAIIYMNDVSVREFQYSKGTFGEGSPRVIDVFDIFPSSSATQSNFYLDDIVFASASSTALFESNFDELAVNAYVAQSYPAWWTTWDNNPGTSEDALITDAQAASEPNSAKCDWGTDLMFLAGDKTSGVYTIDFDMYLPNNAPAYFNLLHFFDPGNGGQDSEWAIGVYMNIPTGTSGMPAGTNLRVGGNTSLTPFTVPSNTWFPVSFFIDLDNDEATVKINNNELLTWQFSLIESGGIGERQLGRVDFYPPTTSSVFYIDNFVYASLSEIETFPIIDVTPTEIAEMLAPGATISKTITVKNSGTSIGDYSSWIVYDFEPPVGSNTYNIKHCGEPSTSGIGYYNEQGNWSATVELGAKFSADDLCNVMGTHITKMAYFVGEYLNSITFRIYGALAENKPGELLMEMTKNNLNVGMWNEITLNEPLLIDRSEYWLTVEFFHEVEAHPIFVDTEALVAGGNWIRFNGGAWSNWSDYGNFTIRGTAVGKKIDNACWLSLTGDTYGNVLKNSTKTFNAVLNATGMESGEYNATIYVATNDENHPLFEIPCTLLVSSGPWMDVNPKLITEAIKLEEGKPTSKSVTITVSNNGNEEGDYEVTFEETVTWLTLTGDTEGTVPAGENKTFTAVLEAKDLEEDTYEATIIITTTDDLHATFEIPCTLTVTIKEGIDGYAIQTLVYPNPAQDQVTVKSNTFINNLQVFNNMGQMVFATNVNGEETVINTSNYNAGIYFIKINTTEGSQNVKLIIK